LFSNKRNLNLIYKLNHIQALFPDAPMLVAQPSSLLQHKKSVWNFQSIIHEIYLAVRFNSPVILTMWHGTLVVLKESHHSTYITSIFTTVAISSILVDADVADVVAVVWIVGNSNHVNHQYYLCKQLSTSLSLNNAQVPHHKFSNFMVAILTMKTMKSCTAKISGYVVAATYVIWLILWLTWHYS